MVPTLSFHGAAHTVTGSCFSLIDMGVRPVVPGKAKRIDPERAGNLDWHNDLSRLLLEISDAVDMAADERAKAVVIRKLRRALTGNHETG